LESDDILAKDTACECCWAISRTISCFVALRLFHCAIVASMRRGSRRHTAPALRSQFTFKKYGECGMEVSELFPLSRFNCLFILFGRTSEITSPGVMILQVWEAVLVA